MSKDLPSGGFQMSKDLPNEGFQIFKDLSKDLPNGGFQISKDLFKDLPNGGFRISKDFESETVDTWESEEGDPGEDDESETIGDGADVGEEIHDHGKLDGLNDILDEEDGLKASEDVVNSAEERVSHLGDLVSGKVDVKFQILLKWMSLRALVDGC